MSDPTDDVTTVDDGAATDGGTSATPEGGRASEREAASFVEYGIEDKPPAGESFFLGIQHYLTMVGANIAVPLVLINAMGPSETQAMTLIGTFFVVSGVATLLQTTIGNRYPLVQGASFALLAPALTIVGAVGGPFDLAMRELQGAIIAAAAIQVLIGYSGLMGRLKRYLSPVVVAPVIALIGLSLFSTPQIVMPQQNWWLLGLTLVCIVGFSQYLDAYSRYARLFPVLLGIVTAYLVAVGLSVAGIYAPDQVGYVAPSAALDAPIVLSITPLQWGVPAFTPAYIVGMFAGVVASMIESYGDYFAVARLAGVGAPSRKRIDHGIGMEGIGNVFAGLMGTGNGSTSYSENIGAIGITGVASRQVVQVGAVVMLVVGFFGPFSQLIVTIPDPIIGGLFIAMFGQIAAVGLSNLKYVDLDAQRNVFTIGLALFAGLAIPAYFGGLEGVAAFRDGMSQVAVLGPILGTQIVADTVFVIGQTGMAVGGIVALLLDNTIPGTREERGLDQWEAISEEEHEFQTVLERYTE
ncbi:Xanthine/uracil permease [Halopenitus malekzadehii]|uniref:Xanthine/uracil permease n=1 Tax=Halopenitus malekzadehii TaxID=1267564 RepID=A0A1H6K546_9EURY|nr:solute carrier family 23 protein [Halopenitus malekzadehii]SEH68422.1 Xanthine/uracil permease [Halopenitus malekzadehii]